MRQPPDSLCRHLGYVFQNRDLLEQALTHRSAAGPSNERLEFLGDALLNMLIAEELFRICPLATEGELSRRRASLVSGSALADLAGKFNLGDYLRLGAGERKSGRGCRSSILADGMEAIFGAVYLDGGFDSCRRLVLDLYRDRFLDLPASEALKDPKTRLQELLQAEQRPLPAYRVVKVEGEPHAQSFTVECRADPICTIASGNSRREAEKRAAGEALLRMIND